MSLADMQILPYPSRRTKTLLFLQRMKHASYQAELSKKKIRETGVEWKKVDEWKKKGAEGDEKLRWWRHRLNI